jgi:hypothetical protein
VEYVALSLPEVMVASIFTPIRLGVVEDVGVNVEIADPWYVVD